MTNGPEQPGKPWVPPASEGAETPQPPPGAPYEPKETSGYAVASLVLGIVGLPIICPLLIPSILAVVFGVMARSDIEKTGKGGGGMALAGLITGFIGIAAAVIAIIVGIIFLANADFDDPDHDDVPNFLDDHDNNPNLDVIRPVLLVASRAACLVL